MCIALIMTIVYFVMDQKLDAQTGEAEEKDDPFKISDLGQILTSSGFWLVALLCVLYYSAIFPFQKYAVNMLQCNLTLTTPDANSFWAADTVTYVQYIIMLLVAATGFASNFQKKSANKFGLLAVSIIALITYCYMGYMRQSAESIFAVFPLLAVLITPILGSYVDHKGKAASMLILLVVSLLPTSPFWYLVPASHWFPPHCGPQYPSWLMLRLSALPMHSSSGFRTSVCGCSLCLSARYLTRRTLVLLTRHNSTTPPHSSCLPHWVLLPCCSVLY